MFSVVVTLFNKEAYIDRCILSVLSQTFSKFELLIIDDGSTDSSLLIAKKYIDKRIKIICQNNSGPGPARNRGVIESTQGWIVFLDADDAWSNDHLEEIKLLIDKFDNAGIVATKSTETKGNKLPERSLSTDQWQRKTVDYFRSAAEKAGFINSSSVAINRNVFQKIGYFRNVGRGEDTEFWARVCLSYPCAVSNKPTSFYFRETGGIMEQLWVKQNKKQTGITSVKSISVAVSLLVSELEIKNINQVLESSVIIFINSQITQALKIEFYNGRIKQIKSIGECYMQPISAKNLFWKYLSKQPLWLLDGLSNVRIYFRNSYYFLLRNFNKITKSFYSIGK